MDRHVTSGRGGVHVVFSIVNSLMGDGCTTPCYLVEEMVSVELSTVG